MQPQALSKIHTSLNHIFIMNKSLGKPCVNDAILYLDNSDSNSLFTFEFFQDGFLIVCKMDDTVLTIP